MLYTVIIFIFLYYCSFLLYYKHLLPPQNHKVAYIYIVLTLGAVIAAYLLLNGTGYRWLSFHVVMAIMIAGLRLSTGMNWTQAVHGGSLCVLNAYSFRGIFTSFFAFIFNDHNVILNAKVYYTITLFALPFSLLFLLALRKTIFPDSKHKRFLSNGGPLKLVVAYELTASINLAIVHSGRYLSVHALWYTEIALGASVLTLGMLIYAIYQSIRSTELLEYQWRTQILEDQYERQLRHYKAYQKHMESFKSFRHDYKAMMASLKVLLKERDNEKAIALIDDIFDGMQNKVSTHKGYSDNIILDAMLQDLSDICAENGIRFSSNTFVPTNTKLSMLDAIRILSNLSNNAVEACLKRPVSERFIDIVSKNEPQWAVLQIVNAYDGVLLVENGKIVTRKSDKLSHGLGLDIVHETVEGLGGFTIYDADAQNNTFLVRVHVPRHCPEEQRQG